MDKKIFLCLLLVLFLLLLFVVWEAFSSQTKGAIPKRAFTLEETYKTAKKLGISLGSQEDLFLFNKGMNLELEHGRINPLTNITNDCPIKTAKIVWCHMAKEPSCYEKK